MQILRNADNSLIAPRQPEPIATNPAYMPVQPIQPGQPKVMVNGSAYPEYGMTQAPSAPARTPVAPNPVAAPTSPAKVDLSLIPRAPSSSEIIAAAQRGYREPGNAFSAFAQGWTNAQALGSSADRERQDMIAKTTYEQQQEAKKLAEAERIKARQIEYLDKLDPGYAEAVRAGVWDASDAFQSFKRDQAEIRKGKEPQSPIGKLGYDLKNGLIDQAAYDAGIAEYKNKGGGASSPIGKLSEDFKMGRIDETTFVNGLIEMAPKGMVPQKGDDGTYKYVPGQSGASFDDVSGLRKEIQQLPSYKNLSQALPIYRSMAETASRNSKASDLNLVYGLGKIMDPTSVVREGEMVMVKNTASLPDWLQGAIASLNGGAALTPETREAIMREAYGRVQGYDQAFQQDTSQYQGIVDRAQMNRADVIPDFGGFQEWKAPEKPAAAGAAATAPQPGAPAARPRATNPETGAVVEFDGEKWISVQ